MRKITLLMLIGFIGFILWGGMAQSATTEEYVINASLVPDLTESSRSSNTVTVLLTLVDPAVFKFPGFISKWLMIRPN